MLFAAVDARGAYWLVKLEVMVKNGSLELCKGCWRKAVSLGNRCLFKAGGRL